MAGRPLSAELRDNKDGSVSLRVPLSNGSTQRVTRRFPSREQAERYRSALLAAWGTNLPLPNHEHFQSTRSQRGPAFTADGFADVALAWWKEFYPEDYKNPETADSVGHKVNAHLIPFFAPRVDHISEITYADCQDFVNYKAGQRDHPATKETVVAEAREFTLAEAAEWAKRGKSTMRKAWLAKKFPNAYLDATRDAQGIVKIPVGDLIKAGFTPASKAAEVPYGYSRKNVNEMLAILRRIFAYARANSLMDKDPSEGIVARDPVLSSRRAQPKADKPIFLFDLSLSKRIASHMHIHHQMAFWLMRCVGLRISEAYGIDLGDIYHDEGHMIIRIWQQGGKKFKVKNEKGQTVTVAKKKRTKTKASTRAIPIPKPVAELIELYITAFHQDSDEATPLLRTSWGMGQSAFRAALKAANELEDHGESNVGFSADPHVQRAFFTTDVDECPPRARSIYLGHLVQETDGGAAITETVYTLRRRGVARLLVVAEKMSDLIVQEIGTLVDPTPARRLVPYSRSQSQEPRELALDVLDAAGLLATNEEGGERVVDIDEAAEMLAVSKRHVRELSRQGVLDRRRIAGPGRTTRYGVTLASVQARMVVDQQTLTRHDLCAEFDLTYRELDILISRLGVVPTKSITLGHRYEEAEVNKIRSHFKAQAILTNRSVSVATAAQEVGCTRRTISRFIELGRLAVDQEASTAAGATRITRKSLNKLIQERSRRDTLTSIRPPGSIPISEAQALTGLTRVKVLELRTRGVIIYRTPDYQFHVDEDSLKAHMATIHTRL